MKKHPVIFDVSLHETAALPFAARRERRED